MLPGWLTGGVFGLTGNTVGGGRSGTPDGAWLSGVQAIPPGPITIISGLDCAFAVVTVVVDASEANPGMVTGTNVSVTV